MFDQMSMPVLFAVLISTLAVASLGIFIAVRVMGERVGAGQPVAPTPQSARVNEVAPVRPPVDAPKSTKPQQLD